EVDVPRAADRDPGRIAERRTLCDRLNLRAVLRHLEDGGLSVLIDAREEERIRAVLVGDVEAARILPARSGELGEPASFGGEAEDRAHAFLVLRIHRGVDHVDARAVNADREPE